MSKIPEKTKIEDLIKLLKQFPNTSTVRRLRRELSAQGKVAERIVKLKAKKAVDKEKAVKTANVMRAGKMKRYYRYLKAIQKNFFPDTPLRQLRTMYSRKKKWLDVEIDDAVWDDPSP
tara:strand:- start:631 stop:984 length:354 start_codon:yes stop_codon:yes gene_type:complete